jgi:hypothetical protein
MTCLGQSIGESLKPWVWLYVYNDSPLLSDILGVHLLRYLREAIPMVRKHTRRFAQLSKTVPKSVVASWERQICEWDELEIKKKHAKSSPYRDPVHREFYCLL